MYIICGIKYLWFFVFLFNIFLIECHKFSKNSHLNCNSNSFMLENMDSCHRLLSCSDIRYKKRLHRISSEGNVKDVFLTSWGKHPVVLLKLKNNNFISDFNYGLNLLDSLNNDSKYMIQLIGRCDKFNYYITEYHRFGDGRNIHSLLLGNNTMYSRIELCLNYAEILDYLHNTNPSGRYVFCDSNDINKLLSQLLITDDMKLVMNDVDALANLSDTNERMILCGCRNPSGGLVAPEQLNIDHTLCNSNKKSKIHKVIGYNEKIDIWKIPDVCNYFIRTHSDYDLIKYHLFDIHKQCKEKDFRKRPDARQVADEYRRILNQLSYEHEDYKLHDDL